jgi:tetratricopeptide (TPR) repeat protein
MERQFKFRYASEIVGGFVLVALIILVAGIFVAGRKQGWFERRAVLHTVFRTGQGAFGLREGDEVWIMDTAAGNVGKIVPSAKGEIQTTFLIKSRFMPLVLDGSVAKVRKKFGVAGDSVVQIEIGKGQPLNDGDFIECTKDEELMDTAKKALADVQEVVLPIMKEMKGVLANLNNITGGLEKGGGLFGRLLKDETLAKNGGKVVSDISSFASSAREAVLEFKRLVKGVQKHWLWRRYMDQGKEPELLVPLGLRSADPEADMKQFRCELELARTANDASAIAQNAYNLAVCMTDKGQTTNVMPFIQEARAEMVSSGRDPVCTYVLESQVLRMTGKKEEAVTAAQNAVNMVNRSTDTDAALQCRSVLADLYREDGKLAEARNELKRIVSLARKSEKPIIKSVAAGLEGRILLSEGKPSEAAPKFDSEAELLRSAGLYRSMADALISAAEAYGKASSHPAAADRYFRAGRSVGSGGDPATAGALLKKALESAKLASDDVLCARIEEFEKELAAKTPETD